MILNTVKRVSNIGLCFPNVVLITIIFPVDQVVNLRLTSTMVHGKLAVALHRRQAQATQPLHDHIFRNNSVSCKVKRVARGYRRVR